MLKIAIKDENSPSSLILGENVNSEWEFGSFHRVKFGFKNVSLIKYPLSLILLEEAGGHTYLH